jgi:hypothetical protein
MSVFGLFPQAAQFVATPFGQPSPTKSLPPQ